MTQPTQPTLAPGDESAAQNTANTAPALMQAPTQAHAPHHAPNTDGIWYASYPADVPREIDVSKYESVVQFFDECIAQFRERVA